MTIKQYAALALMMAVCLVPGVRARQSQATFRSTTRLIIQLVTVKDRTGRPVAGLTAKDFLLTEDGTPQPIAFVEYQAIEAPAGETAAPRPPVPVVRSTAPVAPVTDAAPVVPRDNRYRSRRLLIFYFDLTQMPFFDKMRTFENADKYIASWMAPADLVAVMVFDGGGLRLKQDFTDDRTALRELIRELESDAMDADSGVTVLSASAFGEGDETFNIFAADRQLSALQTAVTSFAPVPELKTLVYFGSGLRMTGADNIAQMRATVNAAVRANVTLNPVDARGLIATPPMGDATRASRGGIGMFSGTIAQGMTTQFQRSQDALYAIAKDTGGRAMFDNNDLSLGIARAAEAVTGYYLIGFYSTHAVSDGKYRRIKVALAGGLEGELTYRQGYYADRPYNRFTRADMERQLADALRLEDPITEIPMAAEVNYFQISSAEYFVPVSVRMPASELARIEAGGDATVEIDMIGEIKDEFGVTVRNMRDKVAPRTTGRPVQYETGFTVLPGNYVIKLLARNIATGRIGTFQTAFTVPNLEKETTRLPVSSVVLSTLRVPPASAVYKVKQKISTDAVNPLIYEGLRLIPSVTRTFRASDPLYIFLQAYQRGSSEGRPLAAFVAFYRDGAKVFEAAADGSSVGSNPKSGAVAIRFAVALDALKPGPYDCQVTVLDPAGNRAAFSRTSIVIR